DPGERVRGCPDPGGDAMRQRMFSAVAAMLLAAGAPLSAQVTISGKPYVKLATRAETRQAMLAKITGVAAVWGPWSVLSPIDHPDGGKNIDKPYPPEDELARMAPGGPGPDTDREYQGKGGKAIKWHTVE